MNEIIEELDYFTESNDVIIDDSDEGSSIDYESDIESDFDYIVSSDLWEEIFEYEHHIETPLVQLSEVLTSYLPLLFVPVGVGVVMHLSYLKNSYLEILLIILVSTLLTIVFTAFIMNKLSKKL